MGPTVINLCIPVLCIHSEPTPFYCSFSGISCSADVSCRPAFFLKGNRGKWTLGRGEKGRGGWEERTEWELQLWCIVWEKNKRYRKESAKLNMNIYIYLSLSYDDYFLWSDSQEGESWIMSQFYYSFCFVLFCFSNIHTNCYIGVPLSSY